jgi:hypothetical protein
MGKAEILLVIIVGYDMVKLIFQMAVQFTIIAAK